MKTGIDEFRMKGVPVKCSDPSSKSVRRGALSEQVDGKGGRVSPGGNTVDQSADHTDQGIGKGR